MRLGVAVLTALTFLGCSSDSALPNAPSSPAATPAPTPNGAIEVLVVGNDGSGLCITGATVEVIAGQAVGQSGTLDRPCDVWSGPGVRFNNLTPNVAMTVRASAPGYDTREKVFIPSGDGRIDFFESVILLSRIAAR